MPWWGMVMIVVAAAAAAAGTLLVRRAISLPVLEAQNEVAGFIYGVLGIVYGVLLGFTVIVVWDKHHLARITVEDEANALGDLFHAALAFAPPRRDSLVHVVDTYAQVAIDDWAAMSDGEPTPRATKAYWDVWNAYRGIEPQTQREAIWLTAATTRVNSLGDARRLRLLSAKAKVPPTMWRVLIAGACLTIVFGFFFGTKNVRFHAVMVGGLAGMIVMVLVLIALLERPYTGGTGIEPSAFYEVRAAVDWYRQQGAPVPN
jgi:Protein of unknown function (DUF4239)